MILGTEAICWCIDLRMGLDVLTIQLQRRTPVGARVIFYAQSVFFRHTAASV